MREGGYIDPERVINQALDARDAGRGAEAVPVLRAAIAAHPRNPRLWQTLGVVHRALEESASAIEAFKTAAALSPGDVKPAYGIAQASLEAGRAATALFAHALSLAPGDGAMLLGRAAARMAEGDAVGAIIELDAIVESNPMWIEGQSTLARLRWQMGDSTGFAMGYTRALAALPDALPLWIGLINLLMQVELYAEADATIGQARAALRTADLLFPLEATCASELGDTGRADRLFEAMAGRQDVAIIERHARHLLRTGRADAAAARIEPMLETSSSNQLLPYASLAWRLTDDVRAPWLEGNPALIGVYDLDMDGLLPRLAERLRLLHRTKAAPLGQSVRGGTQTDGPLFAHEATEIRSLRAMVVEAVDRHIAAMGPADPRHPTLRHVGKRHRFAGSWSVRLTGAGHHSNHIHSQGWLSSAFYVAVPSQDQMGASPRGWLQLGQSPGELGLDLPACATIEPRPGRLVLFPSTMWHGTIPIEHGERLTVAFDVAAID